MRWALSMLLASTPVVSLASVYSLSNLSWSLHNGNGSIIVPGKVPSQAHLDLYAAGIIDDPLVGQNEYHQRWIMNDSWIYTADLTNFMQAASQDSHKRTMLVFYGLDTVANITVGGHPVAWVNNQFRQYVYDVTDMINSPYENDHNITVAFQSAYLYGLNMTTQTYEWPISLDFEYPGRTLIRKTQSDFGWDWGPAFLPSGIFRPAYLVTLTDEPTFETSAGPAEHPLLASSGSAVLIEQSSVEIHKAGHVQYNKPDETADWVVNVTLGVRSVLAAPNSSITIAIPELDVSSGPLPVQAIPACTDDSTFLTASMTVPEGVPERWWPVDLGSQTLYNITITLSLGGDCGEALDEVSFNVRSGFRTIELHQTPYSEEEVRTRGITPGDQWYFTVNGQDFYAKGTNIIPFDPFYARIEPDKVRWVLESAVLSGQNMLRVWGGGIYQPSDVLTGGYDFYSLCDELGILAWSELIFSDALYVLDNAFLESIVPEVHENVRRVNKHPSNLQWAGGNELELVMEVVMAEYENASHYLDEFIFLFQDYLHDLTFDVQQSVPYTDCSTTSGVLSLDPLVLRLQNKTEGHIYGNAERYNYDATQAFNYSTFPVSRFVNEFGFHSMPSFYSWEEVLTAPEDFSFNSSTVMARERHDGAYGLEWPNPNAPQGQGQMTMGVELWLPTPGSSGGNQTFAQWCYSTQIFQSMTVLSQVAFYRRGAGHGENNHGAIVWQLNDVWQGPTWSAIEHSGRWKVLNYGLASIFTPVIIYPFWEPSTESLEVTVTNDRAYAVNGTAALTWYDWAGNVLAPTVHEFVVPPLNNTVLLSKSGLSSIVPEGMSTKSVWMLLNVSTTLLDGRTVYMESYFTPVSLANAALVDPQVTMTPGPNYTFTLSAKGGVAPYTWVEHPSGTVGYFVDAATNAPLNGFYLVPGTDRTLRFVMNKALSAVAEPDPAHFVVRSLWNDTHV